jgi:hypothetical protein
MSQQRWRRFHCSFVEAAEAKPEFKLTFGSPENARLYPCSKGDKGKRQFDFENVNRDHSVAMIPGIPVEITQLGITPTKWSRNLRSAPESTQSFWKALFRRRITSFSPSG